MTDNIETFEVILVYEDGREESDEFAWTPITQAWQGTSDEDWERDVYFRELAQEEGAVDWRYADD